MEIRYTQAELGRDPEYQMKKAPILKNEMSVPELIQDSNARDYMRQYNSLVRESSKIKEQPSAAELGFEENGKNYDDRSRKIILLREKNKKLKLKLKDHEEKYQQYEHMLENNIQLREKIRGF